MIYWRNMLLGIMVALLLPAAVLVSGLLAALALPYDVYDLSLWLTATELISPLLGGFSAGWLIRKRGWINGGWVGALYGIAIGIFKSVLLGRVIFSFSWLFVDFCLGCIGGICGVNVALFINRRKKRDRETALKGIADKT